MSGFVTGGMCVSRPCALQVVLVGQSTVQSSSARRYRRKDAGKMLTAVPHAKVNSCIESIFAQKLCVPGDDCEAHAPVTVNPDYSSAM